VEKEEFSCRKSLKLCIDFLFFHFDFLCHCHSERTILERSDSMVVEEPAFPTHVRKTPQVGAFRNLDFCRRFMRCHSERIILERSDSMVVEEPAFSGCKIQAGFFYLPATTCPGPPPGGCGKSGGGNGGAGVGPLAG
jgi:hypothetical protein